MLDEYCVYKKYIKNGKRVVYYKNYLKVLLELFLEVLLELFLEVLLELFLEELLDEFNVIIFLLTPNL